MSAGLMFFFFIGNIAGWISIIIFFNYIKEDMFRVARGYGISLNKERINYGIRLEQMREFERTRFDGEVKVLKAKIKKDNKKC